MKKQAKECTHLISLLEKVFKKPFKVLCKFSDTADKFLKLFVL